MSRPFFSRDGIKLLCGDVLTLREVRDESVDLVVTSPPYNVDIQYGEHDDRMDYERYLDFSRDWMTRCFQWLKPDGRMCLNIPLDKNKGGQQSVCADLTTIAKEIGYRYHSTIIWNEQNISRRTAWGSWMSASAPFVIAPVECVVVLYKASWKKTSGSRVNDISRQDFLDWTNGVWTFNGESKKRVGHPAPFPIELPRRCIKLFSFVDDVVLDPFSGSGTSMVAAFLNDRQGVGIDVDRKYCALAQKRIEEALASRDPEARRSIDEALAANDMRHAEKALAKKAAQAQLRTEKARERAEKALTKKVARAREQAEMAAVPLGGPKRGRPRKAAGPEPELTVAALTA